MLKKQANKLKVVTLLLCSILLSGCTVNYDITIKSDRSFDENLDVFRTKESLLEKYDKMEDVKKDEKPSRILPGYKYKYKKKSSGLMLTFSKSGKDLNDLFKSTIYNSLYSDFELIQMEEYVSFKTVGNYTPVGVFTNENGESQKGLAEKVNINIQFHNVVLENNADSVNKKTNTYTWTITSKDDYKKIQFKFSNKKRYDVIMMYFVKDNLLAVSTLLTVTVVPTITLIVVRRRSKSTNKI